MSGFDYGNARLRVRASKWLTGADYQGLLNTTSLESMLGALAQGPYADDIAASIGRQRGIRRLDEALRIHLSTQLIDVLSFYEDEIKSRLSAYLARWDVRNVRSLLRDINRREQEAPSSGMLVAAGALTAEALAEIAAQRDVRAAVDLLSVWRLPSPLVIRHLRRALPDFIATGDILSLEQGLDRAFADHVQAVGERSADRVAEVLAREVDRLNLLSVARLSAVATPGSTEIDPVGGGRVPADVWVSLAGLDRTSLAAKLLPRLPRSWAEPVTDWAEGGDTARLEQRLADVAATEAIRRFRTGDPLGLDIPLGYISQQEAEAQNLRLVGRAVADDLPRDDVYGSLLGVA